MRARSTRRWKRIGINTAGAVVAFVALFPVYWMVLSSFKRNSQLRTLDPQFLPTNPTLDNYRRVFERDFFWTAFRNSAMVTTTVVFLALTIAFFAAVALSRFRFRGRKAFLVTVIAIQMIPAEALIISLFQVLDGRDLTNRIIGLSLTYLIFVLPFTIWTLRGFVGGVPLELEDAARVDGASRLGAFMRVTLPLIAPGLVATGIFAVHPRLERVHLRPRPHEPPRNPDGARVAERLQRRRPWHGLGRGHGGLDHPGRAGRDLLPPCPAQGHGRPHRGSREGMNVGVDVGGTTTRAVVFDATLAPVDSRSGSTPPAAVTRSSSSWRRSSRSSPPAPECGRRPSPWGSRAASTSTGEW